MFIATSCKKKKKIPISTTEKYLCIELYKKMIKPVLILTK